jgi:aminoglycoside 6'-N-acetyltransferase I
VIRKLLKSDREKIEPILNKNDLFTDDDRAVALELIDEAINKPDQDYYHVFVYTEQEKILGYYCTGKRPLTDGVFDLYWIVVDPEIQNKGIGKQLLTHSENFVVKNNGRLIIAETSGKDDYLNTRKFYTKNNYSLLARIKDFYKIGDDLIIFGKYL